MNAVCKRFFIIFLSSTPLISAGLEQSHPTTLFIVFMAARNDLYPYAGRNIKQLQAAPSSDHVKIFVRLDSKKPDKAAKTKQFFIERGALKLTGSQEYKDSGDGDSLVETIKTAYTNFPAQNVILVIWNHGTGGIEPAVLKALNPSELFHFNEKNNRIELERSIGFIDYITKGSPYANETKGIGFDDSSGNYLTIKKLASALHKATSEILKKKISVLACDACMMAGIDVVSSFQTSVEYFVGSQEVVLGTGYNYGILLDPLVSKKITSNHLFALHCVTAFQKTYGAITEDYTHSALDIRTIGLLEKNIDSIARLLLEGLEHQKDNSVKAALRKSRHKNACTYFKEPTYIDMDNFYENLSQTVESCSLRDHFQTEQFKKNLKKLLLKGRALIRQIVKANAVGTSLKRAQGISIYFPEFIIHKSYFNNSFAAKRTCWLQFLQKFIQT